MLDNWAMGLPRSNNSTDAIILMLILCHHYDDRLRIYAECYHDSVLLLHGCAELGRLVGRRRKVCVR